MKKLIKRIGCFFGQHDFWWVYWDHNGLIGETKGNKHPAITCMKCNRMFWGGGLVEGRARLK